MIAVDVKPEIRRATIADTARVVAMFGEFVASTRYARYVGNNPAWCQRAVEGMLTSDECALFVVEIDGAVVGMLGISVFTQPFSGERVATEHFWWLDPAHRGNGGWLLKRAEKWARGKGASRLQMMAPSDNARVAETYARLGYTEVERIFQRDL